MRGRALSQGIAVETELAAEFEADDQAVLINSLSCRPIASHNGQPDGGNDDCIGAMAILTGIEPKTSDGLDPKNPAHHRLIPSAGMGGCRQLETPGSDP